MSRLGLVVLWLASGAAAVQPVTQPATAISNATVSATVYYNEHSGASIQTGRQDPAHGAAVANFDPNSEGWGKLTVTATSKYSDTTTGAYCMGFAEGYLTHLQIEALFQNTMADWFGEDHSARAPLYAWLRANLEWVRNEANGQHTLFWRTTRILLAQLDGLYAGYAAASANSSSGMTFEDFVFLNADGDVESLFSAIGAKTNRTRNLRCSALFKLAPANADVLFAHTTWDHFTMMGPRMLKSYSYGGSGVVMSSSPGFLSSIDDFYMTSNQLVVIETTNGNFNDSLWERLTTKSVLSWIRGSVANLAASSTNDWRDLFSHLNSGTYCNQWLVFDMKLFQPGRELQPGSFLVLEQLPGLIHSEDKSAQLQQTSFWASYNIPYFQDIYNMSGFGQQLPRDEYSHQSCPRAQIFNAQHKSVSSVESMQRVIRYNDWKRDPLSKGNPCNGISARCDLNDPNSKNFQLEGGLDGKASSYLMAQSHGARLSFTAQLGPTHDDNPVFDWSRFAPSPRYPKAPSHVGQPDKFDFDWTTFSLN